MNLPRRAGRPPVPPPEGKTVCQMTFRVPAEVKERMMEQSEALDITMTEYLVTLVERDR